MKTFSPNPAPLRSLTIPQPGSVVSRVLFRNRGCTVTAFAFAEGEGLSEHATPQDALLIVLEGELRISLQGEDHHLKAGDILHIPASRRHTLHPGEAYRMLLVLARDEHPPERGAGQPT